MTVDRIARTDFLPWFGRQWRAGDHLSLIGPTGRGKSTFMGQLIPHAVHHDVVAILAPKGRDPAYAHLGHSTSTWPPKRGFGENFSIMFGSEDRHRDNEQKVWRIEVPVRKIEDFMRLRGLYGSVLGSVLTRPENTKRSMMLVVDDSRFVCDPKNLNLASVVTADLILGRSKRVSMVNNFQAPRWVPREGLDQITYGLVWRNRDRDVAVRLAEISGDLDRKMVEELIGGLDYHEALFIDGRSDLLLVVGP